MEGPSESRSDNPRVIIDPKFCACEPLHLTKDRGDYTAKGNKNKDKYKFTFNGSQLKATFNSSDQLIADRNPLLLLTLQHDTARKEGKGFKFREQKELLHFSVKKSIKQKTRSDVFLAGSKKGKTCDFNITGKWGDQSCKIYHGEDSSVIIAQMHEDNKMTVYPTKDYPNVDYTFIVALVVVRDKIDP